MEDSWQSCLEAARATSIDLLSLTRRQQQAPSEGSQQLSKISEKQHPGTGAQTAVPVDRALSPEAKEARLNPLHGCDSLLSQHARQHSESNPATTAEITSSSFGSQDSNMVPKGSEFYCSMQIPMLFPPSMDGTAQGQDNLGHVTLPQHTMKNCEDVLPDDPVVWSQTIIEAQGVFAVSRLTNQWRKVNSQRTPSSRGSLLAQDIANRFSWRLFRPH